MAPRCGCGSSSGACACRVIAGENITVTGAGSAANPYVIAGIGGTCGTIGTRAAILALRDAGSLDVGCAYILLDPPAIGVPGFQSVTNVMLWATATNELSLTGICNGAHHQPGFNSSWTCEYDIDANAYLYMADALGNQVRDETGAIIASQFPWGFSNVRGNVINSSDATGGPVSLVGWGNAAAAGVRIAANKIDGGGPLVLSGANSTIVDLTGLAGSNTKFYGNEIRGARFAFTTPSIDGAEFTNNTLRDGFRLVLSPVGATSSLFVITGTSLHGHALLSASNDLEYTGNDTSFGIIDSELIGGANTIAASYAIGGVGTGFVVTNSKLFAAITRNSGATNQVNISVSDLAGNSGLTAYQVGGVGNVNIVGSDIYAGSITRDNATVAPLTIRRSKLNDVTLVQGAAALGGIFGVQITESDINQSTISQSTPGALQVDGSSVNHSIIQNALASGRGLRVVESDLLGATIEQRRTVDADANGDGILSSRLGRCVIVFDGAAGQVGISDLIGDSTIANDSSVTITNYNGSQVFESQIFSSTLVTSVAGAFIGGRLSCNASLNTSGFAHTNVIIDGFFVKVATAANANTLTNKAFDDFV